VEHLFSDYIKLQKKRDNLIRNISNKDMCPVNKSGQVKKHIKHFAQFINPIL